MSEDDTDLLSQLLRFQRSQQSVDWNLICPRNQDSRPLDVTIGHAMPIAHVANLVHTQTSRNVAPVRMLMSRRTYAAHEYGIGSPFIPQNSFTAGSTGYHPTVLFESPSTQCRDEVVDASPLLNKIRQAWALGSGGTPPSHAACFVPACHDKRGRHLCSFLHEKPQPPGMSRDAHGR